MNCFPIPVCDSSSNLRRKSSLQIITRGKTVLRVQVHLEQKGGFQIMKKAQRERERERERERGREGAEVKQNHGTPENPIILEPILEL